MNLHLTSYGQGLPIVFFHGWGFDSQVWQHLVPELEANYQLILVDLPGFGLSSMMDWLSFKLELLARLPQRFAIVGWSLGGLYATRLAIEAPDRVRHLLNITSSPRFIQENEWPGISKTLFLQFHQNLAKDFKITLRDFVALQSNNTLTSFEPGTLPSESALKSGLNVLDAWDLRADLHTLTVPTHYIFGRLDPITPALTMQTMQRLYPHFTYKLFTKSAHMPFLSHTQEFIVELSGFIPCNDTLL